MKSFRALSLLALFSNAAAFLPQATSNVALFKSTRVLMSESPAETGVVVDENFDDVDITRLLGLKRVKNIIRRHAREAAENKAEEEEE